MASGDKKQTKVAPTKRDRRIGGRITAELYKRLERIAEYEQRSVSAQMQVALTEWVENKEQQLGKDYRRSNLISPAAGTATETGVPALVSAYV